MLQTLRDLQDVANDVHEVMQLIADGNIASAKTLTATVKTNITTLDTAIQAAANTSGLS